MTVDHGGRSHDDRRDGGRPADWTRAWWAVLLVAVAATVLARILGHVALNDVPHVQDEQTYWLQARTMALGRIFTPVELPRAAFNTWFVDDRWARFGIFPPGWPAVLALGVLVHAPFWVNPVLHGLSTALVSAAGNRLGGSRLQIVSAVLYGFSPQALLLAASLMSHSLVAFAASVVLLACVEGLCGTCTTALAAWTGVALGIALLTRPLCAGALALEAAVVFAWSWRRRGATRGLFVAACLPVVAALALLLSYNEALTGRATRFPQTAYFDEHAPPVDIPTFHYHPGCNDLGFGPGHGCQEVIRNATHTLQNALSNTGDNLFAWCLLAGGGPLVFFAAARGLKALKSGRNLVLGLPVLLVVLLYALYWYGGTCYGARFYQAGLPFLIVLGALGLCRIAHRRVFALAMVAWLGWNAMALVKSGQELSGVYWATDARFQRLLDSWNRPASLVMVAFTHEPAPIRPLFWTTRQIREGNWMRDLRAGAALSANAPLLDGPVVFAKFHPALVGELRERFPGRQLWIYVDTPRAADDYLVRYDPARPELDPAGKLPPKDNFEAYEVGD
jgi:hypothetical protein